MNQYVHQVFSCSSCEHYQQAEDKTESFCFINVASVLICCRLCTAALMPSLNVCVCAWTASACRSTRACSSTRSVCVTSVSQSETFPQFSSHVIIQCCCRTGEYDVTVCVCLLSDSCWHRGGERRLWSGNLSTVHWQTAGGERFPWCSCQTDFIEHWLNMITDTTAGTYNWIVFVIL